MKISLIAALDLSGGIGIHGKLPWRLSEDLQRFKKITMGHHLVMGRKTWESIRRPLAGRTLIVVTRQPDYQADGCEVVHSLQSAINFAAARGEEELFVIGGGELFTQALPQAERMYLTQVHTSVPADVFFPEYDPGQWEIIQTQDVPASKRDEHFSTFYVAQRISRSHDEPE
jgi:dihydrofolate reductase